MGAEVSAGLHTLGTNFWTNTLPKGCELCREGSKLVLYLTGECQSHCYYCPVGRDRMYVDRAFANEREIAPGAVAPVIEEARAIRAKGVGITGGDPMTKPERVAEYCKALKQEFGPAFHIHLYTQNVFDPAWLPKLKAAGLDEIRFHAPVGWWDKMAASPWNALLPAALQAGLRTGLEVPAIPYKEADLFALCMWAASLGAEFVNLNELEFSEANMDQLVSRGFTFLNDSSNVVKESRDTARRVVETSLKARLKTAVHFCASTYKDSVQLRKRLQRRAETVERPLEAISPDGTLLFGVIETDAEDLEPLYDRLVGEFQVPLDMVQINRDVGRVEVAPWYLEDIHEKVGPVAKSYIVEVYPTATRLEVERTPLPYPAGDWDADGSTDDEAGPAPNKPKKGGRPR